MPDYNNGKIYKLINSVDDNIYIGSTINQLFKRKMDHKSRSRKNTKRRVYSHPNSIGWENVSIILIEEFSCDNKDQLRRREDYYIQLMKPVLNSQSAIDTCLHGRNQNQCVECRGAGICEHRRRRCDCIECNGNKYKCDLCHIVLSCKSALTIHNKSKLHVKNLQSTTLTDNQNLK